MRALLVISHGSQSSKTKEEVAELVETLRNKSGIQICEFAFLEIERPSIIEGIDLCVEKGAQEIIVLLNFLNAGRHVDQDIPAIIEEAKKKYPNSKIVVTNPIGQHSRIPELFLDVLSKT